MKCIADIETGEEFLGLETIDKLGDKGNQVAVFDSNLIEGTIVNTQT